MSARSEFQGDEGGGVLIEFTAVFLLFITLLFGVIEFSYAFYQWNAATKAMQIGARHAAVSDPVMRELPDIDGLDDADPGEPLAGSYLVECSGYGFGATYAPGCRCTGSECPAKTTYDKDAMQGIVDEMKKAFPRIDAKNVSVVYEYTKLGYAGRPGGPVPTITVSLRGLNFDFVLLSAFLGSSSIAMPNFATTVTGEDLRAG